MNFLLDFNSGKISPTSKVKGLVLNKKDVAKGVVVEAQNEEQATSLLTDFMKKWQTWVDKYNYWLTDPERDTKFPYTFPPEFNKPMLPGEIYGA